MSLGGCVDCGAPYDRCEEALDSGDYTTDANGNHDGLCCEDCQHLADHPVITWPKTPEDLTPLHLLLRDTLTGLGLSICPGQDEGTAMRGVVTVDSTGTPILAAGSLYDGDGEPLNGPWRRVVVEVRVTKATA